MGCNAAHYVATAANRIAKKVDNALLFGSFGDLTTSSGNITTEKPLTGHPNIKKVVGNVLDGNIALKIPKHHPKLHSRTYSAPVLDLKGIMAN